MPQTEYLRAFKGLYTNVNPHDTPPGTTVVQDNVGTTIPGVMAARKGIVPLAYTGFTSAGANSVFAMLRLSRPEAEWLLYELSDGTLKALRDGAQQTLRSGLNNGQPICGGRMRQGFELMFNGLDRGAFWDGLTAVSELAGVDSPTSAATTGTSAGTSGGATAGNYLMTWRYVDIYGNPSNLAPVITQAAPDFATFTWAGTVASLQNRCSSTGGTIEFYRTTSGETGVYYLVGSTTAGGTGFVGDTFSDDALSLHANLPVTYPNGNYLANRFVPPPTNKPFFAIYRDRGWWYGNVTYSTGTIEVQSGTPTILRGTGTAWTPQMVGRYVTIAGAVKMYLISAYTSATQLTLAASAPTTAAGATYTIRNKWSEYQRLYYSEQGEIESVPPDQNAIDVQQNVQDNDFETGIATHNLFLYLLHQRHIYKLWFSEQPDIDASIQLIAERGCINNHCWTVAEGTMFLLDQLGAYAVTGDSVASISDQIQDYWRDNRLDFTTAATWWAEYEPNEKIVKFFVRFTGDSGGTRPRHALCYSPMSNSWWTETFLWDLGHGVRTTIAGQPRLVAGGALDTLYKTSEGLSDGITTAIRGTATGGGSTTLTDSGATFASTVVGATVAIISGPGKGSQAVVTARTSTQLTVAAWSGDSPAAGSVYLIGAIGWIFKTGPMRLQSHNKTQQRIATVAFQPTTYAAQFDARRYYNHDTSPDNYTMRDERPDGFSCQQDSPDGTIDMLITRNSQRSSGNAPGYNWVEFDDGMNQINVSDRWLAMEFRGFQGLDRIKVYNAQILGVNEGEE